MTQGKMRNTNNKITYLSKSTHFLRIFSYYFLSNCNVFDFYLSSKHHITFCITPYLLQIWMTCLNTENKVIVILWQTVYLIFFSGFAKKGLIKNFETSFLFFETVPEIKRAFPESYKTAIVKLYINLRFNVWRNSQNTFPHTIPIQIIAFS